MKERPILFSSPMVRAILKGRKTQTRRVVKPQPAGAWAVPGRTACPYGRPGDRLWVRETWRPTSATLEEARALTEDIISRTAVDYRATSVEDLMRYGPMSRADAEECCEFEMWKPSVHMPRWASRITLEITGVRVERLQEISSSDIIAEGVQIPACASTGAPLLDVSTKYGPAHFLPNIRSSSTDDFLRAHWASVWSSINGIDSWDANPWVWVVSFKRVTP